MVLFKPMCAARRRGFTLIEIMLVLSIVGFAAAILVPRISFYYEPPGTLLQRSFQEAGDLALSGVSVRFVLKPLKDSRRGEIVAEALLRREPDSNDLSVFLGTAKPEDGVLAWTPVKLAWPPAGEGWHMEPEVVYFYTDGSCTPARISWAGPGVSENAADRFLLTVTGWCTALPERQAWGY